MNPWDDPRPEILLDVDYGYSWPMSTIFWEPEDIPDWERELPAQLYEDLRAWAKFFNDHANSETGMFGSERLRKHFDLEGVRLRDALEDALETSIASASDCGSREPARWGFSALDVYSNLTAPALPSLLA